MKKKEFRVFVVSADTDMLDDIFLSNGGIIIDMWNDLEQQGKELPEEAKKFINIAESTGRVYSIKGYMTAVNINDEIGMNDWIFISSAY